MTIEGTASGIGVADVEARIAESPAWLQARRQTAWDAFTALPWPSSMRDEDWRRTDISKLRLGDFSFGGAAADELVEATRARIEAHAPSAAIVVCNADGSCTVRGAETLVAQGIIVCSLTEAAERHAELVQRGLGIVPAGEQPLTSLWNATWRGGVFVRVPRSLDAATPLWIIHAAAGEHVASTPAVVCVVEENASLQLFEVHVSPAGDAVFSNAVTAIDAARDARVDHCVLQDLGDQTWHTATHRVRLDAGARLRFFGATFGSRLQKAYWEAILDGTGAEAQMAGIALARGTQHLDHQSLQAHRAADTTSRLTLKVAVADKARSVYSGMIDVAPEAQHTDAYVQNRNLILSQGAKADSIPRLEIKANDVKCGHGSTAGHIDSDQRFYLMARGVSAEDADRIIVRGFLDDATAQIPHTDFAAVVAAALDDALGARDAEADE